MTRKRLKFLIIFGIVAVLVAVYLGERSLYDRIRRQANLDEAQPADAIVVFGAAQYDGRPSPVYKARLDHAFDLEERGLAPIIITTGGSGGDKRYTEGGVGKDYLIQEGVAADKLIAETHGDTTYASASAVAALLRRRGAKTCIAVSDGFHLYRIKHILASLGITAYGSPDPSSPIESDPSQRNLFSLREMLIMTLWYLGLHV